MIPRRASIVALATALALSIAGCSPARSDAVPSPTFSSEAEAFAAAEATYREYVKALNAVDLSDPDTFEAVYAWTTGEAYAGERESLTQMHADGWTVRGTTAVSLVEPGAAMRSDDSAYLALAVCLDISEVTVVDDSGMSVVDDGRPDVQSMSVTLTTEESSPTRLLISGIDGRDGEPRCDA